MKQRRLALNLTQSDVAELAGVTVRTIGKLERSEATKVKALTAAGIERALQWAPGSLDTIRDGGEPTELQQPTETEAVGKQPPTRPGTHSDESGGVAELRQSIRDLDQLPGYVQRVVLDQAVDELPRAIAALDDERRGRLVRYAFGLWDEMGGTQSTRRLAVTLDGQPAVWELHSPGNWVMIRSLYADAGHAPFPERVGGAMPAAMIEERHGRLRELPDSLVARIEQSATTRRVHSDEMLDMFFSSGALSNQRDDAGRASHTDAADNAGDSAASPDADSGDGISGFNDHREGA
ncbi:helix-turn-helix domain-containing protein [Corynebacterium lactis]|nr:helix-turn-helix transcriptional regulator [Corynebacterium lactis]